MACDCPLYQSFLEPQQHIAHSDNTLSLARVIQLKPLVHRKTALTRCPGNGRLVMAQPSPPQIPQHVSALLSHLTSRPGVQSTLILSRKDGSIIQSTGLLAANTGSTAGNGNAKAPVARTNSGSISTTENPASGVAATAGSPETVAQDTNNNNNVTTLAKSPNPPYKPSQAEALAAHIHAFMTSASGLTLSLSGSTSASEIGHDTRPSVNGAEDSTADDQDKDSERDEDDEIKLLRLRTKKHEIVVVPDRKYLLCVVHDASGASASAGASR